MSVSQLPDISPPRTPEGVRIGTGLSNSASAPVLRDGPQRKQGSRQAFLERQQKHASVGARRNLSELQKRLVRDGKAADDAEFLGAAGREGFKKYLVKNFGTVVCGWRALDKDKNGRISFYELCNACRNMGYHGNMQALWKELDANGSGFVSIMEIDPEVGHYIGTFKLALMRKYGDMITAWQKGIDTNTSGKVEEKEIAAAVLDLGLDLDSKKLFRMMKTGPKGMGMTMQEFDPDAWQRHITGDKLGLTTKANKEFLEDLPEAEGAMPQDIIDREHRIKGGAKKFRKQLVENDPLRQERLEEMDKLQRSKAGLHTIPGFKSALIRRCGSILSAWRTSLDLDGNGRLTFNEFCRATERLGLFGDVQGLWRELVQLPPAEKPQDPHWDPKEYVLLFAQLDPKTSVALQEMQTKLEEVHGNLLVAWLQTMDVKGTGLCAETQFQKALVEVGVKADAKELFKLLQPNARRAHMTLKDFDNKAYLALTRGDFKMISEKEHPAYGGKGALELTFEQRQEIGWFYQVRRDFEASRRAEFKKACKTDFPPPPTPTPMGFEEQCIRRFGSLTAAWRLCLDTDGNGKLTFNEWSQGLRRLGYAGGYKELWKHYDADKSMLISLKELDPQGHKEIQSFLSLLCEKFGNLDVAWRHRDGFNKDPAEGITKAELENCCKRVNYPYDVDVLIKNLSPLPGRQLLTIWDIDPECTRKRQQGLASEFRKEKDPNEKKSPRGQGSSPDDPGSPSAWRKALRSRSPEKSPEKTAAPDKGSAAWQAYAGTGGPSSPGDAEEMAVISESQGEAAAPTSESRPGTGAASPGGTTKKKKSGATFPPSPHDQLKNVLKMKYGSTSAAWRSTLDSDWQGSVGFNKFLMVADDCGFRGNVKKLWEELTFDPSTGQGRAGATFEDIDPEAHKLMGDFREILLSKYGNLECAFKGSGPDKGLDQDHLGRIDQEQFESSLDHVGCWVKWLCLTPQQQKSKSKRLWNLLLSRHGQRSITVQDLQALLIGVPHENHPTMWAGNRLVLDTGDAEAEEEESPDATGDGAQGFIADARDKLETTLPGSPSQSSTKPTTPASRRGTSSPLNRSPSSPVKRPAPSSPNTQKLATPKADLLSPHQGPREHANEVLNQHHSQDRVVKDLDAFRHLLVTKYGSLFSAWRRHLDMDQNGIITQTDFAKVCQHLGVKACQKLWAELDANMNGQISLCELDPDCAEMFAELEKKMLDKRGNLKDAWKGFFDPDPDPDREGKAELPSYGRCDLQTFTDGCTNLGFDAGKDTKKLFKLLQPEPGRHYLLFVDLWGSETPGKKRH